MFFGGDFPGEGGTGDRGAEDDCSNCETGHSYPVAYVGARYAVDKRVGGRESWEGDLGVVGSVVEENWLGICGSLLATFSPFLHSRKFHGGQSPL